jgi:hypothetical protein
MKRPPVRKPSSQAYFETIPVTEGGRMSNRRVKSGKEKLLEHYRRLFRTPENLDHYSPEDYELAERKFLKSVVIGDGPTERKNFFGKTG